MDAASAKPTAAPAQSATTEARRPLPAVRGFDVTLDRIRRNLWVVATIVLVFVIAAGAAAFSSSSTFTAQSVLSVATKTRSPVEDATLAQGYVLFFNESNYRHQLAERAGVDSGVIDFSAQTAGLSPVFYITAKSESRATAQTAAAAVGTAFADEINGRLAAQRDSRVTEMNDTFRTAYQNRTDPEALAAQARLQQQIDELNADTANQVTVLEPSAGVTEEGSGALTTAVMLLVVGVLLGGAAAIAVGIRSKRLDTDYDVVEKLGIEPLDVLPGTSDARHAAGRAMRVQHVLNAVVRSQDGPMTLAVATASGGDSAAELALSLAQLRASQGVRTVFVDANVRSADDGSEPGLAELLASDPPDLDTLIRSESEALQVLGPGRHIGDSYALFDRDRFTTLIQALMTHADFVVVAAPPLARAGEAQLIGDVTDRVLLVLDTGTRLDDAREAVRVLDRVDATLLGAVLIEQPRTATKLPAGRKN